MENVYNFFNYIYNYMNNIIYKKIQDDCKINKYIKKLTNTNSSNINYDMNKIYNKELPELGRGSFGIVYLDDDYAIKYFPDDPYYDVDKDYKSEKDKYINDLLIYCGKLESNKYIHNDKNIELNELNYTNKDNKILIYGNILDYIKSCIKDIGHPILNECDRLIIDNTLTINNIIAEYILDDEKINIGTCIFNVELNEYKINIDSLKIPRLYYFDDVNRILIYKYLGQNLRKMFSYEPPPIKDRILLCFDLIRQMNDLIKMGIYHNDFKNDNIVISCIDSDYFISIIDYGISIFKKDIKKHYSNRKLDKIISSPQTYSPEYYKINYDNLSLDEFTLLCDKMHYWMLGGICINILLWEDKQIKIWEMYYNETEYKKALKLYNTNKYYIKAGDYIYSLKESLININCDLPIYNDLIYIIKNLLNTNTYNKCLLSDIYTEITDYPKEYQEYYKLVMKTNLYK